MRHIALSFFLLADSISGYGEGNMAIVASPNSGRASLSWDETGDVLPCAILEAPAENALVVVTVTLPEDAIELAVGDVCALISMRSDKALNWWFVSPPPAELPKLTCAPSTTAFAAGEGLVAVRLSLHAKLPLGYTRVTAFLRQPRHSTTPLVDSIEAVVAVVAPPLAGGGRPSWLGPPQPALSDATLRSLSNRAGG